MVDVIKYIYLQIFNMDSLYSMKWYRHCGQKDK